MSDDDLGFRTGPKKPRKRKSKSAEAKGDSKKVKRSKADSKQVKRSESKKTKRSSKSELDAVKKSDTQRKKRPSGAGKKAKELPPLETPSKLPLIAGAVVAVLIVGGILAILSREPEEAPTAPETTAILSDQPGKTQVAALPRPDRKGPVMRTQGAVKGLEIKTAKTLPVVTQPQAKQSDSALERLRKKSSTHAAIARVLDELKELFDPKKLANPGPNFSVFKQRRQREAELIKQLSEMGPLAVDALKDMLLGLNNNHHRIVMGKALAGIEGPQAADAIGDILKQVKDVSIQTAIVRNLPESRAAADTIAEAFKGETNSTLRSLLLHEYSNRLDDNASGDVFREAAQDKDINVRATAVTIIGRRGNPNDAALMENIIDNEKSLMIRQKAILSYATTGGGTALPKLESLARDPKSSLAVRASAVLAIGRVGGKSRADAERAIMALENIAATDRHPEIKSRAQARVRNLRRNLERKDERNNRREPLRVEPGMGPIQKR